MPNDQSNTFFPVLVMLHNEDGPERFVFIQKPEDLPINKSLTVLAYNVCRQCEEMAKQAYSVGVCVGKQQQHMG